MRIKPYALFPQSLSRWACSALVLPVVVSGLALALLMVNSRTSLRKADAVSPHSQLGQEVRVPPVRPQNMALPSGQRVGRQFAAFPLSFEENRGQAAKDVRYLARGNGSLIFLTKTATLMAFPRTRSLTDTPKFGPHPRTSLRLRQAAGSGRMLRLELANGDPKARTFCSELLPGESSYFLRNDPKRWVTHIPNCARVRYEHVYPGTDLVYYGNHEELEYDFILAAGADPGRIRLNLRGPQPPRLSSSGDLVMSLAGSQLLLRKPRAYQTGRQGREWVRASYAIHGTSLIGFELGAYDHSRPLIIDPVLIYSTYLGGSGGDEGEAVSVDSSGNMYLVGTTSSTDFPTTSGVVQHALSGIANVFVTKLSSAGSLVFSTYLGGSGSDNGAGIAVDSAGNVYVTGSTTSTNFPTTAGVVQTTLNGPSDAFVAKLNSTGSSLTYSTYLGGSGSESGNSIAVNSAGNAYITGFTTSSNFPTTTGSFQTTYGGGTANAFITELSADATTLVYSSFLGGSGSDSGASVAIDASGAAFVTGTTSSTNFPTAAALQPTLAGQNNAFVTEVSAGGTALQFSTYLGGSGADQAYSLALDGSGNVYVTGSTTSSNFPTKGPAQSQLGGATNAFVSKLNAEGSALVYSTFLGGSASDGAYGIAVDSSGNAYVVGVASSSNFPSVNPIENFNSSPDDAFVVRVAPDGASFAFSSYLGGSGIDYARGVAVDSAGNIDIIGTTNSSDFPVTPKSFQTAFGKISNVFVSQIGSATQPGFFIYPTQLTFSGQGVGTTSTPQTFTVRNMGTGVLNTNSIATTGDFEETNTCGGVVSGAGECVVSVTFSPAARGSTAGTLVLSDNAATSPQTVTMTGTGILPVINLTPNTLTFPSEPLNTSAPTQTVSMNNSGVDPSTITSIYTSGDFTQINTCGTSLAAGANCTITVAFTPTLNGPRTGTLYVVDNAAGSPHTVSLTGTGVGPDAKLSFSALSFTEQPLGTTSGPQLETLTNDGSVKMTIAGVSTTGAFAQSNNCGTSLPAGANCVINVTFSPTVAGNNSGVLIVLDNAPGNPHTVVLSGDAVSGSVPEVYLSPSPMSFGGQPDSTTSAAQVLTLTNTGNATLQITNSSLTGSFTLGTNTCSSSLAAGASCTAKIAFAPTAPGPTSGTYSVTDNASGSPQVAALVGGGTDFGMSASPASATVTAGQSATYTLTLTPVNGFTQTVSPSCSGLPPAASCAISPATLTLDGTHTATATVTVSTTVRSMLTPGERWPKNPQLLLPFGNVALGTFLILAALTALSAARSRRMKWLVLSVLLLVFFWAACDVGTQKITVTPAGNYTFSLTGSYAANGTLQHNLTLGLTVH